MKNITYISIALMLTSLSAQAQKKFLGLERGGSVGVVHYLGDLNPEIKLNRPNYYMGLLFKYNFNDYISLGAQANFGKLGYADSLNSSAYEKDRNLNFTSTIADLYLTGEFNFFRFQTGNFRHRWTPYIATGLGVMYYNPTTYFRGNKYVLKELGTEGKYTEKYADRSYNNLSAIIPVGFGVKFWLRPGFNMAIEATQKFSFTDYIDDVSTTYVGADKFIFNNHKDVSYYIQDRSIEVLEEPIGIEGRQRGTSTDFDAYVGFQIRLTYIPQRYVCPRQ